jgi:hypothetical protein
MTDTLLATGLLATRIELWTVAADARGIWVLHGGAVYSEPLRQAANPLLNPEVAHRTVGELLEGLGAERQVRLIHSTSWRATADGILLTYVAVLGGHGQLAGHGPFEWVRDVWRDAIPLSPRLLKLVCNPVPHGATERPVARDIEVLTHGVRHFKMLLRTDATAAAALDDYWRFHLGDPQITETFAGLYQHTL